MNIFVVWLILPLNCASIEIARTVAPNLSKSKTISNNPFASALSFYWNYRRNKLSTESTFKIAKKYASKPGQLLKDLSEKYQSQISNDVSIVELERIITEIIVAKEYLALLPDSVVHARHNSALDPTSSRFDVNLLFSTTGTFDWKICFPMFSFYISYIICYIFMSNCRKYSHS